MADQMADVTPAVRKEYVDKLARVLCQISNLAGNPRVATVAANYEEHVYSQSSSKLMYVSKMNAKTEELLAAPQRKAAFPFGPAQGQQAIHPQQIARQHGMAIQPLSPQPDMIMPYDMQQDRKVYRVQPTADLPQQQFQKTASTPQPMQDPQHQDFARMYYEQYDMGQYASPRLAPSQRPFQQDDPAYSTPLPIQKHPTPPQQKQKQKTTRKRQQAQIQQQIHQQIQQPQIQQAQIQQPQIQQPQIQQPQIQQTPPWPQKSAPQRPARQNQGPITRPQYEYADSQYTAQQQIDDHHPYTTQKIQQSPLPVSKDRTVLHQYVLQMRRLLASAEQAIETLLQFNALNYAKLALQMKLFLKKQLDSPQLMAPDLYTSVFTNISERLATLLKYCDDLKSGAAAPPQQQIKQHPQPELSPPQALQQLEKNILKLQKQPQVAPQPQNFRIKHHQVPQQQPPFSPQQQMPQKQQQPVMQQMAQNQVYKVDPLQYQYQQVKQFSPQKHQKHPSPQHQAIDRDQQIHAARLPHKQQQPFQLPHDNFLAAQSPEYKLQPQQKVQGLSIQQQIHQQPGQFPLSAAEWQQRQAVLQHRQFLLMKQRQQQMQPQQQAPQQQMQPQQMQPQQMQPQQMPQHRYPAVYVKQCVPLHQGHPAATSPLPPSQQQQNPAPQYLQQIQIPQNSPPRSPATTQKQPRVVDQQQFQQFQPNTPQKRPLPDQQLPAPPHQYLQQDFAHHVARTHRQNPETSSPQQAPSFRSSPSSQPNKSSRTSPFIQLPPSYPSIFTQSPPAAGPQAAHVPLHQLHQQPPAPEPPLDDPVPTNTDNPDSPQDISQRTPDWLGDSMACLDYDIEQEPWGVSARPFHDADDIPLSNPGTHDYEQLCF